jgi:hypothetical protein
MNEWLPLVQTQHDKPAINRLSQDMVILLPVGF